MKHARRKPGRGAFDLIEEATHLLRSAPAATLAVYYAGAIPFAAGLLFFWADMSRSPFAGQHLAGASFGMVVLFCWMKCWQAHFARCLRAQVAAQASEPLGMRRGWSLLVTQMILQPTGLFLIPLSLIPVLPFAWVYTFYQNATVLADGGEGTLALCQRSWRQTSLWPRQNLLALAILAAFGLYVFLNWATVFLVLPGLIKMLFGVESTFTLSPLSMLNTTFLAVVCGLTYLCVDPILKALYVLRCFYGESLRSGEDLKAELRSFALLARAAVVSAVIIAATLLSFSAKAADAPAPAHPPVVSQIPTPDLDQAINETIHERRYTWRMPREAIPETKAEEGRIGRFFDAVGVWLRERLRVALEALGDWLKKLFGGREASGSSGVSGFGWIAVVHLLLWGLVAVVLAALMIFLHRLWLGREKVRSAVATEPIHPMPDITDENAAADQLPEDGWTRLARELLERGEFRLAMRAFYLASLSHLATTSLITLARCKSNRDYQRELGRRAHSLPGVLAAFGDNLGIFERIWYGTHEADLALVQQFASNVERIKAAG